MYADVIQDKKRSVESVFGFINCTEIQIQRPGGSSANNRVVYSEHKKIYCLVYQTVITPNGLNFNMFGPKVGRRPGITH